MKKRCGCGGFARHGPGDIVSLSCCHVRRVKQMIDHKKKEDKKKPLVSHVGIGGLLDASIQL